jgi:hypothetical protein
LVFASGKNWQWPRLAGCGEAKDSEDHRNIVSAEKFIVLETWEGKSIMGNVYNNRNLLGL